ncbi:MAG: TatA/E family twin arginine-targeting protein translocase [Bryobacteraceae bacterium]
MGPLGVPETVFIFVLALLIFGPKKLPELGKTIGKAMMEFRRASSELKATFDREMHQIERENESLKEVTQKFTSDIQNFNHDNYYDSGAYGSEAYSPTAESTPAVSASAPQGAESTETEITATTEADKGTQTASVDPEESKAAASDAVVHEPSAVKS